MFDINPPPNKLANQGNSNFQNRERLQELLRSKEKIRSCKTKKITFSLPILWQLENAIFFPNTINVIQGKAGVHKSRLAELICASLLKTEECQHNHLNFEGNNSDKYVVCYVDTERNHSEQFPFALQQIQIKAGYALDDEPKDFDYVSLLEYSRNERSEYLRDYLIYVRKNFTKHLFIVLDVITDCVSNFNDINDSMKLIDMMNQMINNYNVTFLCLIHENPSAGDKARGHLGTEIMNKASTVMQIGYEKDKANQNTDLIKVTYLKCRSSKKHEPFYVQYSEEEKGLVLADENFIIGSIDKRNHKAELNTIIESLGRLLDKPLTRTILIEKLCSEMDCKERTIEIRLKTIIERQLDIPDKYGVAMKLFKRTEGKETIYYLDEPKQ